MNAPLKINADFDQRIVIKPKGYIWTPSPVAGVERMILDHIGDEVARATASYVTRPIADFSQSF